jgi:hypothetical protein
MEDQVGKTYKDVRDFDVKRVKEQSRKSTKDQDLRTRVKPVEKKSRGGGTNWRHIFEIEEEGE